MIEARIAKIVMVGSLAAFVLLVTFDNLPDYGTNYEFVRHVLSMDTTHPGNPLLYRRVTSPVLWHAAYGLIIAGEGLTGLSLGLTVLAVLAPPPDGSTAASASSSSVRRSGFSSGSSGLWSSPC
jgi:predicted small integral membrane protein